MNVTHTPFILERVEPPVGLSFWKRFWWVQLWKFTQPFDIVIVSGLHRHEFHFEAGDTTDFASIPKLVKWLFPEMLVYGVGPACHDELYETGEVGKRIADGLLAGLLIDCDQATEWQAEIIFLAVHMFGFKAWNDHRKQDASSLVP